MRRRFGVVVSLLVSSVSAKVLSDSELQEMSKKLRGDDNRLIRPTPSEAIIGVQNDICPFAIPSLVETLNAQEQPLGVRGTAAEVLHLCGTNNAANQMDIGVVTNVFSGLKNLVQSGMKAMGTLEMLDRHEMDKILATGSEAGYALAQASECVWSLSANNNDHQQAFLEVGMVEELIDSIQRCPVFFDQNGFCSAANMWSLAALSNLAATYCDTPDGVCDWQRNDATRVLSLPRGVRATTTADKAVRAKIMEYVRSGDLGKLLNYFVCSGPVNSPPDPAYSWPSKATYPRSVSHPEILPWSAAALVESLAIDESTRRYFSEKTEDNGELFVCLCAMYKSTPDGLEDRRATLALYRMGWDDYCPSIYDHCTDTTEGWIASDGKTCADYEAERLCATNGSMVGTGGLPANEACCACGGGVPSESSQSLSNGAMRDFQRIMEGTRSGGGGNCGSQ